MKSRRANLAPVSNNTSTSSHHFLACDWWKAVNSGARYIEPWEVVMHVNAIWITANISPQLLCYLYPSLEVSQVVVCVALFRVDGLCIERLELTASRFGARHCIGHGESLTHHKERPFTV